MTRWYHEVDWQQWGLGVTCSYFRQKGPCAGTVFVEVWLGPLALGVGYHWWGAQRA